MILANGGGKKEGAKADFQVENERRKNIGAASLRGIEGDVRKVRFMARQG